MSSDVECINDSEEVVFKAVIVCGGSTQNEEPQSQPMNVLNEELDLYNPPSPAPPPHQQQIDFEIDDDDDNDDDPYYQGFPASRDNHDNQDTNGRKRKTRQTKLRVIFNKKKAGVKQTYTNSMTTKKPYDFLRTFLNDRFLQKMVDATNHFAHICKENNQAINSWIQPWRDTNVEEMKKFIGIIVWMGLVKYPTMNAYWCRSYLYTNYIMNSLSRNKFQLLSHMWRLGWNDDRSADMISPLINELRKKFKQMLVPPEVFAIEKTFIPAETESEGINILFLNVQGGYIYDFAVDTGQRIRKISGKDVMPLISSLLDKGRTMCTTEELTSVNLAKCLVERKTHLVGLLNPNSSHIPAELKQKRLSSDETQSCTTADGLIFRKYNPFFEEYLLTTRRNGNITHYYKYRAGTTISNDLKVNNSVLLNSMNWYQKFAVEIVINACLINSCYLYRKVCAQKNSSIRFMEDIIVGLLDIPVNLKPSTLTLGKLGIDDDLLGNDHILVRLEKSKRCVGCYERICRVEGRKAGMNKGPKTPHHCPACNKSFCIECFFVFHTGRLRNLS